MSPFWSKVGTGIKTRAGSLATLVKTSVTKWWAMDPFRQSAVIAYYAIFSLPALLVVIVTIAGFALGADVVNGKILEQIKGTMGAETAAQIKVMLAKASETKTSIWATVLGVVTVIVGSIGVFVELQKTLNIIWEVEVAPKKGVWGFLRARVFSFGLILSIAFMLMISLVVSTGLAAASDLLRGDASKFVALLFEGVNFFVSIGVISLLFALMFKFLPDTKITWRQVWLGALVTGLLFTLGKTGLAFYFGKASPGSGYGAAGSIILILLWVSYSSMILFLGAEFTHTYADMHSDGKKPEKGNAKPDTKGEKVPEEEDANVGNGWLKAAPFVLPLAAAIHTVLPFLLPFAIKRIAKSKGATIDFKLTIPLLKPVITLKDLTVQYGNPNEMVYAIRIGEITLEYVRSSFFKGLLDIQTLLIRMPFIDVVQGTATPTAGPPKITKEAGPPSMPLILRRLTIEDGRAGFKNLQTSPTTELMTDHLNASITSSGENIITLSTLIIDIHTQLLEGTLDSHIVLEPGYDRPSFSLQLELKSLNLVALNNFFLAYAKMDVHTGTLDLFSEATSKRAQLKGYVKPLIKNLEILGAEDSGKSIGAQIKEGLAEVVKDVLENHPHQQVATEVPFEGYLSHPQINMAHALLAVGVNIFIQALSHDFSTLFDREKNKMKDWAKLEQ